MAVEKVSVSLDADLLAEIRRRSDNVSAWLAEAAQARLRNAHLGELLRELDEEFGPVPEDVMERASRDLEEASARVERAQRAMRDAASADPR